MIRARLRQSLHHWADRLLGENPYAVKAEPPPIAPERPWPPPPGADPMGWAVAHGGDIFAQAREVDRRMREKAGVRLEGGCKP